MLEPIENVKKQLSTLRSLRGAVSVEDVSMWRTGHVRKTNLEAHFTFWSPQQMLFEFSTITGPNGFCVDGHRVVAWPSLSPGRRVDRLQSVEEALHGLAGVSLKSSIYVPGLLLRVPFRSKEGFLPIGEILADLEESGRITTTETVGDSECVVVERHRNDATITFWIDKTTSYVRRIVEVTDESQMAWKRAHGGGGITGDLASTSLKFDIAYSSIDETFADDLDRLRELLLQSAVNDGVE